MRAMNTIFKQGLLAAGVLAAATMVMGAQGDGCAAGSRSDAPDVAGAWDITYEDDLDVTIKIGGAVYEETIGAEGGQITIDHNGSPITFDLDCSRPEVICPSEAWPANVTIEQRNENLPHQMIVTLPMQRCDGVLVQPAEGTCGPGTRNPDCEQVCDGEVVVEDKEAFGVIGESGETFRLFLGAGFATNGVNCALVGGSVADADLVNQSIGREELRAVSMENGTVKVGYAGGCLWAGDPNGDGELEALVLGASIEFETHFTGKRK